MASSVSNGPGAARSIRSVFIWDLAASFSLSVFSLSLILGPSSASHSRSEDGGFLSISGSQLTHEDVTQNTRSGLCPTPPLAVEELSAV